MKWQQNQFSFVKVLLLNNIESKNFMFLFVLNIHLDNLNYFAFAVLENSNTDCENEWILNRVWEFVFS